MANAMDLTALRQQALQQMLSGGGSTIEDIGANVRGALADGTSYEAQARDLNKLRRGVALYEIISGEEDRKIKREQATRDWGLKQRETVATMVKPFIEGLSQGQVGTFMQRVEQLDAQTPGDSLEEFQTNLSRAAQELNLRPAKDPEYRTVGNTIYEIAGGTARPLVTAQGGAGGGPGMWMGNSADERALRYLVESGQMTPRQAAEWSAGRLVAGPSGQQDFVSPLAAFDAQARDGITNIRPALMDPKARDAARSLDNLSSTLDLYANELQGIGTSYGVIPTDQTRRLDTAYRAMQMELKNLFELGAITGPDYQILLETLTDPNSLSGGWAGADSLMGQIGIIRQMIGNKRATLGLDGSRQSAAEMPALNTTLQSGAADEGTVIENDAGERYILRGGRWEAY